MTGFPAGWRVVTLNDLQAEGPRAITDGPFGSNLTSAHYADVGPRVVRLQNIGDGEFIDSRAHISQAHFESLQAHEVQAGDLLVASLGENPPRACLAPPSLGSAIVKADCIRVRLSSSVDSRWVLFALQTPAIRRWATNRTYGVGRPRLGLKAIRMIPIPLPPLATQRHILEILESHLSKLDAAAQSLEDGRRRLHALQPSAAEWAMHQAMTLGNSLMLSELSLEASYGTSAKCIVGGEGPPVVRIPNLLRGRVDLSDEKRVEDPSVDVSTAMLALDDLLIVRTNGSRNLIGRTAVVQPGVDAAFASYLIR